MHIAGGAAAWLTGPAQLWLGITGRAMWAQSAGRAFTMYRAPGHQLGGCLLSSTHTSLGWVFGAGLTGLGVAGVTTTLAVVAIRAGA